MTLVYQESWSTRWQGLLLAQAGTCRYAPVSDPLLRKPITSQPERIRGDPYSIRSDVWSTGLTLLELARNKFPFPADLGPIELLSVIVNGDIPELEDEPPGPDGQPGATWSEGMKMFIKRW